MSKIVFAIFLVVVFCASQIQPLFADPNFYSHNFDRNRLPETREDYEAINRAHVDYLNNLVDFINEVDLNPDDALVYNREVDLDDKTVRYEMREITDAASVQGQSMSYRVTMEKRLHHTEEIEGAYSANHQLFPHGLVKSIEFDRSWLYFGYQISNTGQIVRLTVYAEKLSSIGVNNITFNNDEAYQEVLSLANQGNHFNLIELSIANSGYDYINRHIALEVLDSFINQLYGQGKQNYIVLSDSSLVESADAFIYYGFAHLRNWIFEEVSQQLIVLFILPNFQSVDQNSGKVMTLGTTTENPSGLIVRMDSYQLSVSSFESVLNHGLTIFEGGSDIAQLDLSDDAWIDLFQELFSKNDEDLHISMRSPNLLMGILEPEQRYLKHSSDFYDNRIRSWLRFVRNGIERIVNFYQKSTLLQGAVMPDNVFSEEFLLFGLRPLKKQGKMSYEELISDQIILDQLVSYLIDQLPVSLEFPENIRTEVMALYYRLFKGHGFINNMIEASEIQNNVRLFTSALIQIQPWSKGTFIKESHDKSISIVFSPLDE